MKTKESFKKIVNGILVQEEYFVNGKPATKEEFEEADKSGISIAINPLGLLIILAVLYCIYKLF